MTCDRTDHAGADVALRLVDVTKRYGSREAVSGVSLCLTRRKVLGLVGPNGAGKSTLLKIAAGLVRPSEGGGEVLGEPIGPRAHPCPFLGIMVEKPTFIEHLSGRRNLRLLASLRAKIGDDEITAALGRVGLDPCDKRPVRSYSQGMRQRLSLAQAMMERPGLMLLDEPTNGLDPEGIVEMRGFIRAMADDGAAVVLASHLLGEVEAVCDSVIIVSGGRVRREYIPGAASGRPPVLLVVGQAEQVADVEALPNVVLTDRLDDVTVELRCDTGVPELVRRLVANGVDVEHVGRVSRSLEDLYLSEIAVSRS